MAVSRSFSTFTSAKMEGHHLHSQAKEVIHNVREYFQMEKENGGVLEDINQTVSRTVAATGVSRRTVERVMKEARNNEDNQPPKFSSPKKSMEMQPLSFSLCVCVYACVSPRSPRNVTTLYHVRSTPPPAVSMRRDYRLFSSDI